MAEQEKIHYYDLKQDLNSIRSNEEDSRRAKAKLDLLSWISQVNYSSNYDAAQLRTYENDQSGRWFLESQKFRDWSIAQGRSGLVLTGICELTPTTTMSAYLMRSIAGGGKTIMCTKAISSVLHNRSLNDGKARVIYFYFDFNDVAKQSVEGMVRSLIYQLVARADRVPKAIQTLYSKHQSTPSVATQPRLEEWQTVLVTLLQTAQQTFVFIDALDECAELPGWVLTETLQQLYKKGGARNKWLLTARTSPNLLNHFTTSGFVHLNMEDRVVNKDIELHLKVRLEADARLASFTPKAKEMIISSITSNSAGM
jgi:hypothetical protein